MLHFGNKHAPQIEESTKMAAIGAPYFCWTPLLVANCSFYTLSIARHSSVERMLHKIAVFGSIKQFSFCRSIDSQSQSPISVLITHLIHDALKTVQNLIVIQVCLEWLEYSTRFLSLLCVRACFSTSSLLQGPLHSCYNSYASWLLLLCRLHCRAAFQASHNWLVNNGLGWNHQHSPFGSKTASRIFQ